MDTLLNQLLTEQAVRQFVDAFNDFCSNRSASTEGERNRIQKEKERLESELGKIKRAILQGVDAITFVAEIEERQREMRELQEHLAMIDKDGPNSLIRYDAARLGNWVGSLRNNLLACDFFTRREAVHRFIKKIVPTLTENCLRHPFIRH
jgi:uncharacterized protein YukE